MNPSHRHNKPSSVSPNWFSQLDIAPRDPRINSSVSYYTINKTQHAYIPHQHPNIMTPSHHQKKPRFDYPNQCGQRDIAYQYPRYNSSGSNSKIKDTCDSSVSDDNGHYYKGRFRYSHSSHKCRYRRSHDSSQPDNMNNKDTIEYGWSVWKRKTTPSAPGVWNIMKQWIILSTLLIGETMLLQA